MIGERTFSNDAGSVTAARRYVLDALGPVAPPLADSVALMVSELSANAVRHTATHFTLSIDLTSTRELPVGGVDTAPPPPRRRPQGCTRLGA